MARFEAVLAQAQSEAGLIPARSAKIITETCETKFAEPETIFSDAKIAGNPAIPFVKALTKAVFEKDAEAGRHVHLGSTSQDVIDTALMLALAECADCLDASLANSISTLAQLAREHVATPMVGRTLLQQATPITFGLKAALWLISLIDARAALQMTRTGLMAVQLAGPVGSLGALGEKGADIRAAMAKTLGLVDPGCSWHSNRGRMIQIATAFVGAIAAGAKIASDVSLLMQSEIGEVFEAALPGKGGSSAMPHKRNPVDALVPVAALPAASGLLASIAQTQVQQNERAAGLWHGEWIIFPILTSLAQRSAEALENMLSGLQVDAKRCLQNLSLFKGLLASEELASELAQHMDRNSAHKLVEALIAAPDGFENAARGNVIVTAAIESARLDAIFQYVTPVAAAAFETNRILDTLKDLK